MRLVKSPKGLLLFCCLLLAAPFVYAQTQQEQKPPEEEVLPHYTYERAIIENFSRLYWALSKLDLTNDRAIDAYLRINECDIYTDYIHNEFQWKKIRESARNFLKENKSKFPLRFEILQPLTLKEYDIDRQRFEIGDEYKIKGVRRFEVLAQDRDVPICGHDQYRDAAEFKDYPFGLIIELSRPVTLTELAMDPETAKSFIDDKMKAFRRLLDSQQTDENLYKTRDAYLLMKIKFFSYRQETKIGQQGPPLAEVLGILEGIEVYADKKKKKLLFFEDYRRKKKSKKTQGDLKKELPPGPLLLDDPAQAGTVQSIQPPQ